MKCPVRVFKPTQASRERMSAPMTHPIAAKLRHSLPRIIAWIDQTLSDYANSAARVSDCPFRSLRDPYGNDMLDYARVVLVPEVPFPPLAALGLPEFHALEGASLDGVTYKNTFFVRDGRQSASLYFHELVHVLQWTRLGVEDFLLAYAAGVLQCGYEQSPLERMAYDLQSKFERKRLPKNLLEIVEKETDQIWSKARVIFA